MTTLLDIDPENYDPRSRTFEYKAVVYTVTASDPYGFWSIKVVKGKTPVDLQGLYTSFHEAERAIHTYNPVVK